MRQFIRARQALIFVILASLPGHAAVLPVSPSERAVAFAQCIGWTSAQASLVTGRDPRAGRRIRALHDQFQHLLDAVLPDAVAYGMPPEHAQRARMNAWLAQNELINDALYSFDAGRATRAANRASRNIDQCRDLTIL